MNDNALLPTNRGARIAGKHRSHGERDLLWERGLPAMNDDMLHC